MGESTGIAWTDSTFNSHIGCTKVSPACDFCYAERDNDRFHWVAAWGPGAPRKRTSAANWRKPIAWQREAERTGARRSVFCNSLSDIFDNEVPDEWRADLWQLWRDTPNLDWIPLTKRIGNARKMLPPDWPDAFPHVGMVISVCNQDEADRDIPKLLNLPAEWRGISAEPLLGPIRLREQIGNDWLASGKSGEPRGLDWIILGAESGPHARETPLEWITDIVAQCRKAGAATFVKQIRVGGKLVADVNEFPQELRVQEFPQSLKGT